MPIPITGELTEQELREEFDRQFKLPSGHNLKGSLESNRSRAWEKFAATYYATGEISDVQAGWSLRSRNSERLRGKRGRSYHYPGQAYYGINDGTPVSSREYLRQLKEDLPRRQRYGARDDFLGEIGDITYRSNPGDAEGGRFWGWPERIPGVDLPSNEAYPASGRSLLDPEAIQLGADGEDSTVSSPFVFAQLVDEHARAGGILAPLETQGSYRTALRSLIQSERTRDDLIPRALRQQGFSNESARQFISDDPNRLRRMESALTGERRSELTDLRAMASQKIRDELNSGEQRQFSVEEANQVLRDARDRREKQNRNQQIATFTDLFSTAFSQGATSG